MLCSGTAWGEADMGKLLHACRPFALQTATWPGASSSQGRCEHCTTDTLNPPGVQEHLPTAAPGARQVLSVYKLALMSQAQ